MKKIILLSVFLFLILGGFYFYKTQKSNTQELFLDETAVSSSSQSSQNIVNVGGVSIEGDGDIKIEPLEIKNNKPAINIPLPNLDREVKIMAEMSDDARKNAIAKIQDLSSQLKKDSDNLENLLVLGIYRKMIGDYEGAMLAWEYAGAIRPTSGIPPNNLGDLYAYYLKDTSKAEKYFLQAIHSEPNNIYFYFKIVGFYRDFYKDTTKARAVLEKGIAANPSSSDLKNLLESLQTIKASP